MSEQPAEGPDGGRRPSRDAEVKISVGSPTYATLAGRMYGSESTGWWEDLGDLLAGRPGWSCEFTGEELLWSFGPFGSSMFNVSAPDDVRVYAAGAYAVYDHEADETHEFAGAAALLAWLEDNEHRHADHILKMRDLAAAFDWKVLKNFGVELRVTYDGSSYIGTFPDLAFESAFGADLPEVLRQAREALARAFDAPASVAPDIKLVVRLDAAASAALTA